MQGETNLDSFTVPISSFAFHFMGLRNSDERQFWLADPGDEIQYGDLHGFRIFPGIFNILSLEML